MDVTHRQMVWSHYVPWHAPFNTSSLVNRHYNFPTFQSAGDEMLDYKDEIRQAIRQGIDGFAVDVCVRENSTTYTEMVGKMLEAAEGTDFAIVPCLDVKTTPENQAARIKSMLDKFAEHPNYPVFRGKPLIFTYTWLAWTPEEWIRIRELLKADGITPAFVANIRGGFKPVGRDEVLTYIDSFDVLYSFALSGIDRVPVLQTVQVLREVCRQHDKLYVTSLSPGYYGAWFNGRNDFYQPHYGFDQLHEGFLSADASDQWMHLTSWNDHDETSLLPMVFTSANPSITLAYANARKKLPPAWKDTRLCFAYHRELFPGTLLRIEALALPGTGDENTAVSGRIEHDGKILATLEEKPFTPGAFTTAEWLLDTISWAEVPYATPIVQIVRPGQPARTIRLPEIRLISGWLQNAVTLKVAETDLVDKVEASLAVSYNQHGFSAQCTFTAPENIQRLDLYRNDRPVAVFNHETNAQCILNLQATGTGTCEINLKNGKILYADRKFSQRGKPDFQVTANVVRSYGNRAWTPNTLMIAATADDLITFNVNGKHKLEITAGELARRQVIQLERFEILAGGANATIANIPKLNVNKGDFSLNLLTFGKRENDIFQLRFQFSDERFAWSEPLVMNQEAPIDAFVIQTNINLETPSAASGQPGRNEFITAKELLPVTKTSSVPVKLAPATVRRGLWNFNGDGVDEAGEMHVHIPQEAFTAWDEDGVQQQGLKFDGKRSVKMRLRTWPMGNTSFQIRFKPNAPQSQEPQAIVARSGWSDGFDVALKADGYIKVTRNGNTRAYGDKNANLVPTTSLESDSPVAFDAWNILKVTCDTRTLSIEINGKPAGQCPIPAARSYGNCTWFIGAAEKHANFNGLVDWLKLDGLP
ncbi:MAG: endo-1,3-alpha-glucanase family glycosylhydrolase [Lentisphaeria bacterium]|jgi:hypothetical protein